MAQEFTPQWEDRGFAAEVASLCSKFTWFVEQVSESNFASYDALRVTAADLDSKFRQVRSIAHRYVGTGEPEIPPPNFECPSDERIEDAARRMYEHFANQRAGQVVPVYRTPGGPGSGFSSEITGTDVVPLASWDELQPSMQRIYLNRVRFLAQEGFIR